MINTGITILDDVLSQDECRELINIYKRSTDIYNWHGSRPVKLDTHDEFIRVCTDKITAHVSREFEIDWCQIVLWPKGSYQPPHIDTASSDTVFTSITYLNDLYDGGETCIIEVTDVKAKTGRTVYFDGMKYEHSVNTITKGTRFTLPIWYKRSV